LEAPPQGRGDREKLDALRRQTQQIHARLDAATSQLARETDGYHKWLSQQLLQVSLTLNLVESSYAMLAGQEQDNTALLDQIQYLYTSAQENIQHFLPYCERLIQRSAGAAGHEAGRADP